MSPHPVQRTNVRPALSKRRTAPPPPQRAQTVCGAGGDIGWGCIARPRRVPSRRAADKWLGTGSGLRRDPRETTRPGRAPRPPGLPVLRGALAYWTLAVSELAAFRVKVQVFVLTPPLLHTPDQIAARPLVTLSVMRVPMGKLAEPVVPTGTLSPAGVERALSPARPVAVKVRSAVARGAPQTFATPPPPQVCGALQAPQVRVPPQPSGIVPQFLPRAAHELGLQMGGHVQSGRHSPGQRTLSVPSHCSVGWFTMLSPQNGPGGGGGGGGGTQQGAVMSSGGRPAPASRDW